jgi:molybdopterin molybdotransferase
MRRGQEMREGDVVLQSGSQLTPQAIGLLATVGRSSIQVRPRPTLAILSTGDELVEPENRPLAGQIRNSNAYMLIAQATRAGADVQYLGISRDHVDALTERIAVGLRGDVLVLSGGVSAGKLDLVPGVLRDLGTTVHFHQVAMKPGKPLLFGTCGETLVFGLPGNPVSSFCCFELFVRPALRKMSGGANAPLSWSQASLEEKYRYRTDRPTYHPSRVAQQNGRLSVRLVPWFGSPDLRALADANALALLPVGDNEYTAGQLLDVLPLD